MTAAMAAPITRRRCGRCGGTEQNYDLMELIQSSLIKFVSADGFEVEEYYLAEPFGICGRALLLRGIGATIGSHIGTGAFGIVYVK